MRNDNKMSFSQIKNNKHLFLERYGLEDAYDKSGYDWDHLMMIAEDHENEKKKKYPEIIQKYLAEVSLFEGIHSYRYRIKDTDSLIKKLITKADEKGRKVNLGNYKSIITDLLGIRVLYVFKNDYEIVHRQIMEKYRDRLVENVRLKLQDGDDDSIYKRIIDQDKLIVERNSTYRSIHYILCADQNNMEQSVRLELQTRTIFEEGWSEVNHRLVYKNKDASEYFSLNQLSKILSDLVGNCDSISALMRYLYLEHANNSQNKSSENDKAMVEALTNLLLNIK